MFINFAIVFLNLSAWLAKNAFIIHNFSFLCNVICMNFQPRVNFVFLSFARFSLTIYGIFSACLAPRRLFTQYFLRRAKMIHLNNVCACVPGWPLVNIFWPLSKQTHFSHSFQYYMYIFYNANTSRAVVLSDHKFHLEYTLIYNITYYKQKPIPIEQTHVIYNVSVVFVYSLVVGGQKMHLRLQMTFWSGWVRFWR